MSVSSGRRPHYPDRQVEELKPRQNDEQSGGRSPANNRSGNITLPHSTLSPSSADPLLLVNHPEESWVPATDSFHAIDWHLHLSPITTPTETPRLQSLINMSKSISKKEVSEHSTVDKGLYIIIDNGVYELSGFVNEHPGGAKILTRVGGKDASKQFWKVRGLIGNRLVRDGKLLIRPC